MTSEVNEALRVLRHKYSGDLSERDEKLLRWAVETLYKNIIPPVGDTLPVGECSHGHQTLDGVMLPVNLASACAFSPLLVEESFAVCGQQMRDMGVDLALVSVMVILRDPRWGRSEECFGDDPFLSSRMAEAVLRGIQRGGVDTVAKHYCAQGEMTGGVNSSAARIGMRELREIHLPADPLCRTSMRITIMS